MESIEIDRNFKRGSWDLRKLERRKNRLEIDFPERRKSDRRANYLVTDPFRRISVLETDSD